ncbi:type VII secretion-associated serine protease mycosin [Streptomyces sp. NPDC048629]|uniref:type VII secretion-associated serine protease mycosin n=1 Tax=Streptomyces sp. NPDC048629 TaxID=3154824 RepID=UPI003418F33F
MRTSSRSAGTAAVVGAVIALGAVVAPPSAAAPPAAPGLPPRCAEPATKTIPDLPWPQARLELERVWEITKGEGQKVAVVDSGVDAGVPQLKGHVLRGSDVVGKSGRGDTDCVGHGTFVAGIVAARPGKGVRFAGVAPGATILPVRQTTDGEDGSANSMARGIVRAVDSGARVINVSANSPTANAALKAAVAYAVSKDVLVVASVGNRDQRAEPLTNSYPSSYPDVLGVGAVGRDDQPATFSEAGTFVDVAAPGVDIISLGPGGPGFVIDQGTSFAAPFVTGTAALVRAYHPELTVRQVITRIQVTADRPAGTVPDPQLGHGIVNPYRAVTAVLPGEGKGAGPQPTGGTTSAPSSAAPSRIGTVSGADASGGHGAVWFVMGLGGVLVLFSLGTLAARLSSRGR